jgi:hypothetical protein
MVTDMPKHSCQRLQARYLKKPDGKFFRRHLESMPGSRTTVLSLGLRIPEYAGFSKSPKPMHN